LKKSTGSVRFYKPKTKKTELNRNRKNRKKPSQTGKNWVKLKTKPNRFEPIFVLKNRTEPKPVSLNRFRFFFYFKNFSLVIFFYKIKTNKKWSPLYKSHVMATCATSGLVALAILVNLNASVFYFQLLAKIK
jgi:hypothetical protein